MKVECSVLSVSEKEGQPPQPEQVEVHFFVTDNGYRKAGIFFGC